MSLSLNPEVVNLNGVRKVHNDRATEIETGTDRGEIKRSDDEVHVVPSGAARTGRQ
ncbi:MAG: hypothetical protein HQ518_22095 [Rhodopirellula sp.]|nr:hypothetical protein [Rhodopirellula sp.]